MSCTVVSQNERPFSVQTAKDAFSAAVFQKDSSNLWQSLEDALSGLPLWPVRKGVGLMPWSSIFSKTVSSVTLEIPVP